MVFFEWLNRIDTQLFLSLNGAHNNFFDYFFSYFTSQEIWYPFYLLLIVIIFQKYKKDGIWIVLIMVLAIVVSDQVSGFIKDTVQRLRPSHAAALDGIAHLPLGKRGLYGFVSSHAANTFALTLLLGNVAKRKSLWLGLFLWAILTAYSRIYVGVHYPFDVLAGGILGGGIGWGCYRLLKLVDLNFVSRRLELSNAWQSKYKMPLLLALTFITVTLLVLSKLSGVLH
jgi:undecaprenyl-diphosphatase